MTTIPQLAKRMAKANRENQKRLNKTFEIINKTYRKSGMSTRTRFLFARLWSAYEILLIAEKQLRDLGLSAAATTVAAVNVTDVLKRIMKMEKEATKSK